MLCVDDEVLATFSYDDGMYCNSLTANKCLGQQFSRSDKRTQNGRSKRYRNIVTKAARPISSRETRKEALTCESDMVPTVTMGGPV
jgi:hypothetical protein